jgi:hypothetical protein
MLSRRPVQLGLALAFATGAVVAAFFEAQGVASSLIALLLVVLLTSIQQAGRRFEHDVLTHRQETANQIRRLSTAVEQMKATTEAAQRGILAAQESMRDEVITAQLAAQREIVTAQEAAQREIVTAQEAAQREIVTAQLAAQREIVTAQEAAQAAVLDQQRVMLSAQQEIHSMLSDTWQLSEDSAAGQIQVGRDIAKLQQKVIRQRSEHTRDVEGLLQLYRGFEPRAPMPSAGGWALDPTGLLELLRLIDAKRPKLVVELGCGTSSIWLGYALEKCGGHLISFDHETTFAERTANLLELHQLGHVVDVRVAPLRTVAVGDENFEWYQPEAFEGLHAIDFLLVDGPPGRTGALARFPALHMLESTLADGALVVLDDADRIDEREIVSRWLTAVPAMHREHEIFGRQAVLRYSRQNG